MLNHMGFDVITLGVREFYDGPRGLLPLFTGLNKSTQIVVCNVDFKRDPTLEKLPNLPTRSTILTVDDLKVGIVGYIDDQVLTLAQPGPTITVTEPLECLRNESKILRAQGCHIVLALGGGDTDVDRHLAESLPDVTAFVVKYENRHAYPSSAPQPQDLNFDQDLEYPINFTRLADGGQAYIFAATNHLQLLGKFQITVQTDTLNVLSAKGTPELLDKDAFEDPMTRSRMEYYKNIVEPEANKVIGTTKVYIDNSVAVCGSGECNGGNMMADAVFDYFSEVPIAGAWSQINAAVVNLGSLGESFDERVHSGELRLVDVFQMYPRNDYYVFITMRGDTLLKMLEHSVDPSPPRSKFLQVSGIRFELNKHATGNESRIKNVVVLCTSCRTPSYERVIWIQWYTLAMSRFLAQGGDRYDFTRVPRGYKIETNVSDDTILRQYLKKRSPLMPMIDGRITFRSSAPPIKPQQAVVMAALCAVQLRSSMNYILLLRNGGAQLGKRRHQCVCRDYDFTALECADRRGERAPVAAPVRQLCAV
ncbi:snake venom 5'-nucleotidase-like [Amblyomma americanum]